MNLDHREAQETERLAELHEMRKNGVGGVSQLDWEIVNERLATMRRRLRATLGALNKIETSQSIEEAKKTAAEARTTDIEIRDGIIWNTAVPTSKKKPEENHTRPNQFPIGG